MSDISIREKFLNRQAEAKNKLAEAQKALAGIESILIDVDNLIYDELPSLELDFSKALIGVKTAKAKLFHDAIFGEIVELTIKFTDTSQDKPKFETKTFTFKKSLFEREVVNYEGKENA